MKVTVENNVKEYVLDRVKNVYIGFDDNTEIKLDQIIDYDISLDCVDCSIISFKNAFYNTDIINRFKGNKKNHIIYVNIEMLAVDASDLGDEKRLNVLYDIPCDMRIRSLTMCCSSTMIEDMCIELEGFVK